jgi:heme exporter protein C
VQWNIFAWLAWGMLVVGIRYAAERRRQASEQQAVVQAFEITA